MEFFLLMKKKSKKDNFSDSEPVQHPLFDFVYIQNKKLYCKKHFRPNGMNIGSMRQHIQGKLHGLDYDTGEKLTEPDLPFEKPTQKTNGPNQKPIDKLHEGYFWELYAQLVKIFPNHPRTVILVLARNAFEGELRRDILKNLEFNNSVDLLKIKQNIKNTLKSYGCSPEFVELYFKFFNLNKK